MKCDLLLWLMTSGFHLTKEKVKLFAKGFLYKPTSKGAPFARACENQMSVFLHPHVSSAHVCLLCIYVTYVQVSVWASGCGSV